ncbi:hypothetical protein SS05631_c37660 [Sinorhizobium sp. CCBAU 05631]|nr:hypothetical protein SS05631_c37660 [Sinorhizobium sp. CCBAU 05631]
MHVWAPECKYGGPSESGATSALFHVNHRRARKPKVILGCQRQIGSLPLIEKGGTRESRLATRVAADPIRCSSNRRSRRWSSSA